MIIQYCSDLHIEKAKSQINPFSYVNPFGNILILAGDIGSFYNLKQLKDFLVPLCKKFNLVLYVPGNHEYYWFRQKHRKDIEFLYNNVLDFENQIPNLVFLHRKTVKIGDLCISGATLWTHCDLKVLPRYVQIHKLDKHQYNKMNADDFEYLVKADEHCAKNDLYHIIVTHHCPLPSSNSADKYGCLYYSNVDFSRIKKAKHWIHGHTHFNSEVKINGMRVLCNQFMESKKHRGSTGLKPDLYRPSRFIVSPSTLKKNENSKTPPGLIKHESNRLFCHQQRPPNMGFPGGTYRGEESDAYLQ